MIDRQSDSDTATWGDDERKHQWQKTRGWQLFSGVILVKGMSCVIAHVYRKDGKDKNVGSRVPARTDTNDNIKRSVMPYCRYLIGASHGSAAVI